MVDECVRPKPKTAMVSTAPPLPTQLVRGAQNNGCEG